MVSVQAGLISPAFDYLSFMYTAQRAVANFSEGKVSNVLIPKLNVMFQISLPLEISSTWLYEFPVSPCSPGCIRT